MTSNKKKSILKTKASLPSWFPLTIYSKKLTNEEWLDEIAIRLAVKTAFKNSNDKERSKEQFETLIIKQNYHKQFLASKEQKASKIWGVRNLSCFDAAYLNCALNNSEASQDLIKRITTIRESRSIHELFDKELSEIEDSKHVPFFELINWKKEPFPLDDILTGLPIIVDLDYDDETLKTMFETWLCSTREKLSKPTKYITSEYLEQLKEYGVLQTFDLQLWATLHDSKYTNNVIANAIWIDSEIDTTERLRKVTIPKVTHIFDDWTFFNRFIKQIEMESALEKIMNGMK